MIHSAHAERMKRALQVIEKMQSRLDELESAQHEPIAIIGMGCRFPGKVDSPDAYWELLRDGVDAITEVPPKRWNMEAYYDPDPDAPGKTYVRYGGFFDSFDTFDANFFGIAPREANSLDPQQRLVLQVGWEALEHANQVPEQLFGSLTGVFIGVLSFEHALAMLEKEKIPQTDVYFTTGGALAGIAGRLSYTLSATGPSMVVDTACSGSLVATHLACQSLRNHECNMALAGGVNLLLVPQWSISFSKGRVLAPDGRCKTFDASADGYVRGDGCGLVVLKRLSDAIADGDQIHALIRGSAVNQDGASGGLTVPSGISQEKVIRQALENSEIEPDQVGYIEAHGSGTPLGDPIEVSALGKVFCQHPRSFPLTIGSVKTNFGHLEPAAGVAGLIKTVLAFKNKKIPPHLHFKNPNPRISWDQLSIEIPTELQDWPERETPRIAGVSGFGFTGTNAHVVLQEFQPLNSDAQTALSDSKLQTSAVERPLHILTLSAKTEAALHQLVGRYKNLLDKNKDLNLADLCFTANTRRSHFKHRLSVVSSSCEELKEELEIFSEGDDVSEWSQTSPKEPNSPKMAFLFTGQGGHYIGMGQHLYETQSFFRQTLSQCDHILQPFLKKSLLEVMFADQETGLLETNHLENTIYTQPALFSLEYSLAKLLLSWGTKPVAVMGHSLGEFAAACIAGVFSLEDGLKLVVERARLVSFLPSDGQMIVVRTDEATVTEALKPYGEEVSIGAINGPENIVISGQGQIVEKICQDLQGKGIETTQLNIPHSFHSPLVEPVMDEFRKIAETIAYSPPNMNLVSNVTGTFVTDEVTNPEYWVQHLRQPVRFTSSVQTLHQHGYNMFVEIGPKPVLSAMARQCLPEDAGVWLPILREGCDDWEQILKSLGELYVRKLTVDWSNFDQGYHRNRVELPTYPFQQEYYWIDTDVPGVRTGGPAAFSPKLHLLIDKKLQSPLLQQVVFETSFNPNTLPLLKDHLLYQKIVVAGATYVSMVLAAVELAFQKKQCVLEDVLFSHTLVINEDKDYTVQLVITPEKSDAAEFKLISFDADESTNHPDWTLHTAGKILTEEIEIIIPPVVPVQKIWKRCFQEMKAAEIYEIRNQRHVEIGESFQWLEQMRRGENEAICRLKIPALFGDKEVSELHPGLLESSFATLAIAIAIDNSATWVPFRIGKICFHGPPSSNSLWAYASLKQKNNLAEDHRIGDIQLFDETGKVFLEFFSFEVGKVNLDALLREDYREWLYETTWIPSTATSKQVATEKEDSWLIFTDAGQVGSQLNNQLKEKGTEGILISIGQDYQKLGEKQYELNPEKPFHFVKLIQDCLKTHPCYGIVYLWGLDEPSLDEKGPFALDAAQNRSWMGLLHLVQALIHQECSQLPRLWIVTRGTQAVTEDHSPLLLNQAPLWGLGKVISQEHPEFASVLLDLDHATDLNEQQSLWNELWSTDGETLVAFRKGNRQVARISRYTLPRKKQITAKSTKQRLLCEEGSYLITGGCGGLGLKVAEWMVKKQGAKNLVLVGRRKEVDICNEAKETIQELKEAGVRVLVVQGDVAKWEDISWIFSEIENSMPVLRGIIHAAGVIDDVMLLGENTERFHRVMLPKVQGSWNLHTLTKNMALDFFVCFSSIASLFGSAGQGNYAAGNAFMDALVHHRQALGLPGLSINWGPWAQVGIAANFDKITQEGWMKRGLGMILPEQGLELMERLITEDVIQVGVLPVIWPTFLQNFYNNRKLPYLDYFRKVETVSTVPRKSKLLRQLEEAAEEERYSILAEHIHEQVVRVLGWKSPEQIAPRERLFDAGMDSMMAVEIRDRLQSSLGCSFRSTLLFDYPTVEALVNYVAEQTIASDGFSGVNNKKRPLEQEMDSSSILDELSQDEIAEQLAQELQMLEQEKNQ
ncbi:MAG: SDR family NAD(P)-dependent oxidoreductase [SAR324 cluster bacterium]|nr:SDR family NAD(P)-dependent oxidoreductase [SAR324 cluster bacterium]